VPLHARLHPLCILGATAQSHVSAQLPPHDLFARRAARPKATHFKLSTLPALVRSGRHGSQVRQALHRRAVAAQNTKKIFQRPASAPASSALKKPAAGKAQKKPAAVTAQKKPAAMMAQDTAAGTDSADGTGPVNCTLANLQDVLSSGDSEPGDTQSAQAALNFRPCNLHCWRACVACLRAEQAWLARRHS